MDTGFYRCHSHGTDSEGDPGQQCKPTTILCSCLHYEDLNKYRKEYYKMGIKVRHNGQWVEMGLPEHPVENL